MCILAAVCKVVFFGVHQSYFYDSFLIICAIGLITEIYIIPNIEFSPDIFFEQESSPHLQHRPHKSSTPRGPERESLKATAIQLTVKWCAVPPIYFGCQCLKIRMFKIVAVATLKNWSL